MNSMICKSGLISAAATLSLALLGTAALAETPASAEPTPTLDLATIEASLTAQGFVVEEMESEGHVLEVEARDAEGREVDLKVDRRTGEILSQKLDD